MTNIDRYGIAIGQRYTRADGSPHEVEVIALDNVRDDVTVRDYPGGDVRVIDAFKLAVVRYSFAGLTPAARRAAILAVWPELENSG